MEPEATKWASSCLITVSLKRLLLGGRTISGPSGVLEMNMPADWLPARWRYSPVLRSTTTMRLLLRGPQAEDRHRGEGVPQGLELARELAHPVVARQVALDEEVFGLDAPPERRSVLQHGGWRLGCRRAACARQGQDRSQSREVPSRHPRRPAGGPSGAFFSLSPSRASAAASAECRRAPGFLSTAVEPPRNSSKSTREPGPPRRPGAMVRAAAGMGTWPLGIQPSSGRAPDTAACALPKTLARRERWAHAVRPPEEKECST